MLEKQRTGNGKGRKVDLFVWCSFKKFHKDKGKYSKVISKENFFFKYEMD